MFIRWCATRGSSYAAISRGKQIRDFKINPTNSLVLACVAAAALSIPASAQDYEHGRMTRIEPGTQISVRTLDRIDVNQFDNQVYPARVESDVYGENGKLAIPRGAPVQLMVRVAPDNDLVLDLESVTVHGDRFAVDTRPDRIQSQRMNGIVGAIAGAAGVQVHGPAVDVPRDTVLTFRLNEPLVVRAEYRDHPYSDYEHPFRGWDEH